MRMDDPLPSTGEKVKKVAHAVFAFINARPRSREGVESLDDIVARLDRGRSVGNRSFTIVDDGYAPEEVDRFVDEIASDFRLVREAVTEVRSSGNGHVKTPTFRTLEDRVATRLEDLAKELAAERAEAANMAERVQQQAADFARSANAQAEKAAAELIQEAQRVVDRLSEDSEEVRRSALQAASSHLVTAVDDASNRIVEAREKARKIVEAANLRASKLDAEAKHEIDDLLAPAAALAAEIERVRKKLTTAVDAWAGVD